MAEPNPSAPRAPLLQRARLRFVPPQDRLLLDGAMPKDESGKQNELAFWLTRHIALGLFEQLRSSLEKGSATAGKVPLGWKQEALALEHAAILKTDAGKGPGEPWRGRSQPQLLTRIKAKPKDDRIQLALFSGKDLVAALVLGNAPLHRFAALLALRIRQAGWDKGLDLSWLGKPPALQRPQAPAKPN